MAQWLHTSNPFDNATKENKRKMLILITDHKSRLEGGSANTTVNDLLTRTAPVKTDYSAKYSAHKTAEGNWKAETKRVTNALKDLSSTLIENWDIRIQGVFAQGTPDYIVLLPHRRIPFQNGTIEDVISAVKSLSEALDEYSSNTTLTTLKGEVDTFHTGITGKRDVQQQKEEQVKAASDALEISRKAAALILFRNLGVLIDTFADTPDTIAHYYQLNLIQKKRKEVEFDGTLAASEQKNAVPAGNFTKDSIILFRNVGDTVLKLDIADNPNDISTDAAEFQPGDETTISGDQIVTLTAYFINIKNLSGSAAGKYEIIIS